MYLSKCALDMILTSAGLASSLGFITTISVREPYKTVLSGAQAKVFVSYQFVEGGITSVFILSRNFSSKHTTF